MTRGWANVIWLDKLLGYRIIALLRCIPQHQYNEVHKHLQEMLDVGTVRRSCGPWAFNLRKLNAKMIKDSYILPRIEESLDCLNAAGIFTSLDLRRSYWQVMLDNESMPLTAFTVGPLGFYECVQMPFGLTNGLATFQRLMEACLRDLHLCWCLIYLDDVIIFPKTPAEHVSCLRGVFEKLSKAGLKHKTSKCGFF